MLKRTEDSKFTSWYYEIDRKLLFLVLFLIAVGMLFLLSAGAAKADDINEPWYFFIKKSIPFYIIGLVTLFGTSMLSKKWVFRLSVLNVFVGMCLLLLTMVVSHKINGSNRFVNLLGFNVMPADIMKPGAIVLMAGFLDKMRQVYGKKMFFNRRAWLFSQFDLKRINWWWFLILAVPACAIILFHPDLGTGALYLCVFGAMLFVAGLPWITLPVIFGGGVMLLFTMFNIMPHFHNRVVTWWCGTGDKTQVTNSINSIKHGGLLGRGDNSFVKQSLADTHTDFVFASIVEDAGAILACTFVLGLMFYIFRHLISRAMRANNPFVFYAVVGAAVLFSVQTCINISTALYIIPPKGMTLPFISYGGSSFVSYCFLFGIILALIREDKWNQRG
ncbi:MAG: FtsW/RodA/SpoVE family cell cycle protein [Alphaproteobacteria bacterium]|nr:FtsW/RodA/SpoVE family cell cycle protein [Alphaproteobacteria bacterium]